MVIWGAEGDHFIYLILVLLRSIIIVGSVLLLLVVNVGFTTANKSSEAAMALSVRAFHGWRLFLCLMLVLITTYLAGGQTGLDNATVLATHSPMHPTNVQPVTFEAEARGTIDKVQLAYERYTLINSNGRLTQTLAEALTTVKTCDPEGNVSTLPCSHTMPSAFAANSLINFKVIAYDGEGKEVIETYSFAAGDYPLPKDPIPIRVKGPTIDHLDIVFIPDTDITVNNFRDRLDEVIETLYFKYEMIRGWRARYNFYYSGVQGNYEEGCKFTKPSNMASLVAVADTVAILHQQTRMRDCRQGTIMSSEISYDKTLIHETGHALFGLIDEYCCGQPYRQQDCEPNVWSSLANCQADARTLGMDASNCVQIAKGSNTVNFWRIDPTGDTGCIMGGSQHKVGSNFGTACERRILWRYEKCESGECITKPECP